MSEWRKFGAFLVEEGFVKSQIVEQALREQEHMRNLPLGDVLVRLGIVSAQDMERHLESYLQALYRGEGTPRKKIGAYLVEEGVVSLQDLEFALRYQSKLRKMKLGELLVAMGELAPETLDLAIRTQMSNLASSGWR